MKAYCLKCRVMCEIKDPKEIVLRNGRNAISGNCPKCNTQVVRIVAKEAADV